MSNPNSQSSTVIDVPQYVIIIGVVVFLLVFLLIICLSCRHCKGKRFSADHGAGGIVGDSGGGGDGGGGDGGGGDGGGGGGCGGGGGGG